MDQIEPKTILVTGGLGFIGSHTVVELLAANYNVVIIDNLSNSSETVLSDILKASGVTASDAASRLHFYKGDIRKGRDLAPIFENHNIYSVIHFAGLKSVSESLTNPITYYSNNVNGTIMLLSAMKHYRCRRLIFSSSATVYGRNSYPVSESSRVGKGITNPYGQSKYMIEKILQDTAAADPSWSITILRYFNPCGAHSSGLLRENPIGIPNNIFPYIVKVAQNELKELIVFGSEYETPDGTCLRDFIHVSDVADAHLAALGSTNSGVTIYNVGTGMPTSVLNLIETFIKVNKVEIPWRFGPMRHGDLPVVYANVDKIYAELGWKAKRTLTDICVSGFCGC